MEQIFVNRREDGKFGRFIFDSLEDATANAAKLNEKYPQHSYRACSFKIKHCSET